MRDPTSGLTHAAAIRRWGWSVACLLAFVLVARAPAPAAAAERYVALGDSYSSGTGTRDYRLDPRCERGRFAYPALVAARRPGIELAFVACGGATTGDVLATQVGSVDAATRWVTITVGGNDLGFSSVVKTCAEPRSGDSCRRKIDRAQRLIRDDLAAKVDGVYRALRMRAPSANIIVLGYPHLFTRQDCNAGTFFTKHELDRLNETADQLRDKLRERVTAAGPGFSFVDAIPAFRGHEVCSRSEWLNGLSNPTGDSYHPNRVGHVSGYAQLVLGVMAAPPPTPPPPVSDRFGNDARLAAASDQFLRSADGRYRFVMQHDGNLVLYGPMRALWSSNTAGRSVDHVRMQGDGNLVIYGPGDVPIWFSNTAGHPDSFLIVQNDGNVVIYSNGRAIWSTATAGQT
jgi:lysophospholipase L1-like esterase